MKLINDIIQMKRVRYQTKDTRESTQVFNYLISNKFDLIAPKDSLWLNSPSIDFEFYREGMLIRAFFHKRKKCHTFFLGNGYIRGKNGKRLFLKAGTDFRVPLKAPIV